MKLRNSVLAILLATLFFLLWMGCGETTGPLPVAQTEDEVLRDVEKQFWSPYPCLSPTELVTVNVNEDALEFWEAVMDMGGNLYIDIANIHAINPPYRDIDLRSAMWSDFFKNYNINEIWMTEASISIYDEPKSNQENLELQAEQIFKGYVQCFANGIDIIFYTSYRAHPRGDTLNNSAVIEISGEKRPSFFALQILVEKLDTFSAVYTYSNSCYKFIVNNRPVYVLWDLDELPGEIQGIVNIIHIDGSEEQSDASAVKITETPILIEPAS